jgi:hypothetical protein
VETNTLERQVHVGKTGMLILHLPVALHDKDVEIQVSPVTAPASESELMARINRPLDAPIRQRYQSLMQRRIAETLTQEEHEELVYLTDVIESDHLQRWESVAVLAKMHGTSPRDVAAQFGLTYPF